MVELSEGSKRSACRRVFSLCVSTEYTLSVLPSSFFYYETISFSFIVVSVQNDSKFCICDGKNKF